MCLFTKGGKTREELKLSMIIAALKITLPLSLIFAVVLFWYASWISIHVFPIFKTKVKAVSVDKELFTFSLPVLLFAGIAGMVMGWTEERKII